MNKLIKTITGILAFFFIVSAYSKTPPGIDKVMTKLESSGIQIDNIEQPEHDYNSFLPDTYKEHATFSIPSVAPSGGQVFVCENTNDCENLYQYFDGFKKIAGSYLYKSKDGLVVLQLSSGLSADEAKKLGDIVTGM